jgi:phosphoglycerate kinase
MSIRSISHLSLQNKKVFIRADLNVPIDGSSISSTSRIDASIPTIQYALDNAQVVILTSHLGRPEEGIFDDSLSLKPIVDYLKEKLNIKIMLHRDFEKCQSFEPEMLHVLENVRFNPGEKKCSDELSVKYASIADVFVMDAFGTAHRSEASTYGIGKYIGEKCAGLLFYDEVDALTKTFNQPKKPMLAIVGGSKVSTKLSVLKNLVNRVDGLILGGGILNTFIAAQGFNIGKSLYEPDFVDEAKVILDEIKNRQIFFPTIDDVICAKEFDVNAHAELKKIDDVESDDMIFDLGPKTLKNITDHLVKVSTIMWNGPLGVFEFEQFSSGTEALSRAIADGEAFSLAGGGDTIAAIEKYKVCRKISYISTAGGAFLEFAEGKKLPAIEMLEQ